MTEHHSSTAVATMAPPPNLDFLVSAPTASPAPTPVPTTVEVDFAARRVTIPMDGEAHVIRFVFDDSRGGIRACLMFEKPEVRRGRKFVEGLLAAARDSLRKATAEHAGCNPNKVDVLHHTGPGYAKCGATDR